MGGCPERPGWSHCYVENCGLCFGCGKPMNFDYWCADNGYWSTESAHAHAADWLALLAQWKTKYGADNDGHGNKRAG